jgi:hypothetical protein
MDSHLGRCTSPTTPTIENLPYLPRDSLHRSNRLLLALSGILT